MKILIVNESFTTGGAQTVSIELANALAERDGITIHFAAASGPLRERVRKNIVVWPTRRLAPRAFVGLVLRYMKIMSAVKPSVVHIHCGTLLGICWLAALLTRTRAAFVFTHHSQRFTRLPSIASIFFINLSCRRVIAVSSGKFNQLKKKGIFSKNIVLIPNFVDTAAVRTRIHEADSQQLRSEMGIPKGAIVVTMTGRLVPGKNHAGFISIVQQCAMTISEQMVAIIVGDGPLRSELEALVQKRKSQTRFIFTGFTNDVYRYLSITDIFLFPSEYEILPVVLLEAAASGVPIVCSAIPGNIDVVNHGENGLLVGGGEKEYVGVISRLIGNPQLREDIGKAGIRIIEERFDKKIIVDRHLALYQNVCNINR